MRRMKSLFTVFSVGIAALGFAVLATARLYTDPQCFFVFYQSRSGLDAPPADWNADMMWFFVSETPFRLWFGAYCIGFFLFAWVWKLRRQGGFQTSIHREAVPSSPDTTCPDSRVSSCSVAMHDCRIDRKHALWNQFPRLLERS